MPQQGRRHDEASPGQSLVEVGVMLPVLLLLFVGILDLGRVYFTYISVVNAAREGARYGAMDPQEQNGTIDSHARRVVAGSGITLSSVTKACGSCTSGTPITVTVTSNFQLITSYMFDGQALPVKASSVMVILGQ